LFIFIVNRGGFKMYVDSSRLRPNFELRAAAREQLKGNWGKAVLVSLLFLIITGIGGGIPYAGIIVALLIGGPMTLGLTGFFVRLKRGEYAVHMLMKRSNCM
jgi:uncharacterized membrane protein